MAVARRPPRHRTRLTGQLALFEAPPPDKDGGAARFGQRAVGLVPVIHTYC